MSKVIISYSSLKDSASEAKAVAKKLDTYADNLNNSIYKKLTNYSGNHTGNIQVAKTSTKAKISELEHKSSAYTTYSQDLKDLKDKCVETDNSVKTMISQLTATFKESHGIKNSEVVNVANYFLTSTVNSSFVGRWLNNTSDKVATLKDYITQKIKVWWEYEGGKQFTINVISGILVIALSICAIVAAWPLALPLLMGGTITWAGVVAVAGVVGGFITACNSSIDIVYEGVALYCENKSEEPDPALARQKSNENTIQDVLRREYDSKLAHNFATGIDIVSSVCSAIEVADGTKDLLKKGYKWTKGSTSALDEIKMKDVLTKSTWSDFSSKLKTNSSKNFADVTEAVKTKNWEYFNKNVKSFGTDFVNNLKINFKKDYMNFSTREKGLKSVKNSFELISGGFDEILDIGNVVDKFVLPNVTIAKLIELKEDSDGQLRLDYSNGIMGQDIVFAFNSIKELFTKKAAVGGDSIIGKNILNKLEMASDVNIRISEIKVPTVEIP